MLDTTIHEPGPDAGEVEMTLFAVERSRAQFAWKVDGLDADALRRPFPPSTMSLGGLIKHLALVQDRNTARYVTGRPLGPQWPDDVDFDADPGWEWRTAAQHSPAELYGLWRDASTRSRDAWTRVLADGGLDQPSAFVLRSGVAINLRRGLVDLHDEYARHVGHADLFREAVDGLVGEDPPQP